MFKVALSRANVAGPPNKRIPYNFVPDSFHTAVTAEALRAKIYRKSAISHQRGHFDPKFLVQEVAPTNNFCTVG